MKKPFLLKLLIFLVLFQGVSGLLGGIPLTFWPSGNVLGTPLSMLENTPFNNFLIPGLFLLIVLGFFPLILGYTMIVEPKWKLPNKLNIYENFNNLWAYSMYIGLILILWILIEIYLVGGGHVLQFIFGLLGTLIVIVALSPQVMDYYKK